MYFYSVKINKSLTCALSMEIPCIARDIDVDIIKLNNALIAIMLFLQIIKYWPSLKITNCHPDKESYYYYD